MKIGKKLKKVRLIKSDSIKNLASVLNMTEGNYRKIERDEIEISRESTEKLAKHYNLKVDELINNDDVTVNISNNKEVNAGYYQNITKTNDDSITILKNQLTQQAKHIDFLEKELTEKSETIKLLLKKMG
jgi:transcriptional regulator with XRE-family HTH domain